MAIPTKTDLELLEFNYQGLPFVETAANSSIDLAGLEFNYQGLSFVSNPAGGSPALSSSNNFFLLFGC